jgi:hypothetical protein
MIKNFKIFKNKNKEAQKIKEEPSPLDDIMSDYFEFNTGDERWDGKDYFLNNEYIEHTLKKYNYDYKRLMKRLTFKMSMDELQKAVKACDLDPELYYNPTKESFETMRLYVRYGIKPQKKYLVEPVDTGNPLDDFLNDILEHSMEDETMNFRHDLFLTDDYIAETLRKYHYNYKRVLKRLLFHLNQEDKQAALEACELTEEDLNNPNAETFEIFRYYYFHGKRKAK